jgi:hypothetical protein
LLPLFLLLDAAPHAMLGLTLVGEAQAVVGAPLTPVSVAGVARRTTRRTVAYTSTVAASSTAAASTATTTTAATAPPQAVSPAIGAIVTALPAGCTAVVKNGIQYYHCGSLYYRAAFQGDTLVYVVDQP